MNSAEVRAGVVQRDLLIFSPGPRVVVTEYDVSDLVRQMRREGKPTTAEAIKAWWLRAADAARRHSLLLAVVDPRDGRPIRGEIADLDSVSIVEIC